MFKKYTGISEPQYFANWMLSKETRQIYKDNGNKNTKEGKLVFEVISWHSLFDLLKKYTGISEPQYFDNWMQIYKENRNKNTKEGKLVF